MTKLATATAKRITSDWSSVFPEFDIWKPLWLLRRIGPVVQGIILDRSSSGDDYFATTHVHALTREFPVVSLTLSQRLAGNSGVQERLQFSRHETDFPGVAERLAAQSALSLFAPPTVDEIVDAYHVVAVAQKDKSLPAVNEMEDSILISAAAGRSNLMSKSLRLAGELVAVWPKSRLPLNWKDADSWLVGLSDRAQDAAKLSSIVDAQIAAHKLGKIRAI